MPKPRRTTPLACDGDRLVPVPWDEALDRAAAGLAGARDAHGPDAVGTFSCSKATNEVNDVAQELMRVAIGADHVDSCSRT